MKELDYYRVAGLDVASEIELFGALPAEEPGDSVVSIRFGEVPESLATVVARGAAFQANEEEALVMVPGVARYWIRHGQEILVRPEPDSTLDDIRAFLITSPLGAVLHQRGLLPLHASSVRIGDSCVAIVGPSRAGKSTLSAQLNARGFPLVADDVLAVKQTSRGAMAYPGFCRLRLWEDATRALGIEAAGLPRVRQLLNKFELHVVNRHRGEELPLRRIYLLHECCPGDREGIFPLEQSEGLAAIMNNTYRFQFLRRLPGQVRHFQQSASMLKSVSIARLSRPDDLSRLDEVADWLIEDCAGQEQAQRRAA